MGDNKITEERFEQDKGHARTIISRALAFRMLPVIGENTELAKLFQAIMGKTKSTGANNLSVLDLMTVDMLGPTEKKFFSDIAAYGMAVLNHITGEKMASPFHRKHSKKKCGNYLWMH
jgi:hypothetical protein